MAGNGAIDEFLTELHRRVAGWHRRPDDVVAEAADHLNERIAVLSADGHDATAAAERAIADYGDPGTIADAHLRAAKRPAIPTTASRSCGTVAIVGGIAWIAVAVLATVLPTDNSLTWLGLSQVFHVACAMSGAAMFGLWRRHGGLGPLSQLALIPAALAAPFVMFVWPIPAWTLLLGLASLLFGVPVVTRRLAPLPSSIALTVGLACAGIAVLGAEIYASRSGEDFAFLASTPAAAAMVVGYVVYGLGLVGVGRWLRSEEPVRIPPLPAPTMPRSTAA